MTVDQSPAPLPLLLCLHLHFLFSDSSERCIQYSLLFLDNTCNIIKAAALATTGGEGTADPETALANEVEAEAELGGASFRKINNVSILISNEQDSFFRSRNPSILS
jgi:hypothetical protein